MAANNPETNAVSFSCSSLSSPSASRYFNYVSVSFVKDFCAAQNFDNNGNNNNHNIDCNNGNALNHSDRISFCAEELNHFFEKFYFTDIIFFKKIISSKSKSNDSEQSGVENSMADAVLNLLFLGDFSVRYHCGVEIEAENENILYNVIRKERSKADFLAVRSSDEKVIRAAAEAKDIDLIIPIVFSSERSDLFTRAGQINHIVAKFAAERKTAFCFDLFPFLHTSGYYRSKLFADCMAMIPILRKYKVPIVLAGGALSVYDLRGPYELEAFGQLLGLTQFETTAGVSQNPFEISEYRRKIKSGVYLGNGVELVEENETK